MSAEALAILVFLATTAVFVAAYVLVARGGDAVLRRRVEDRLSELSGAPSPEPATRVVKAEVTGPLAAVDQAARQTARGTALERWLQQSGTRMAISGLGLLSVACGLCLGGLALALFHRLDATLGAAVGGVLLPVGVLRYRRQKRFSQFEEQFPEALDLISRAARAGHAFTAGLKMVADEVEDPVGPEFRKTFDEQNFGMPLKDSLEHLAERIPLLDVQFFSTAVLIQRETGGNLAEILDNLATVVRERFKLKRQVRVHTAHGRLTGYVLLALPAFLAIALSFINPDHMTMLFTERLGQLMLMGAAVMQAVGFFWIQRVVKIEV